MDDLARRRRRSAR